MKEIKLEDLSKKIQTFNRNSILLITNNTSKRNPDYYLASKKHLGDIEIIHLIVKETKKLFKEISHLLESASEIYLDAENKNIGYELPLLSQKIFYLKINDITARWLVTLLNARGGVNQKRVTILGAGNIGSKIALMLAEQNAKVRISRRNHALGKRLTSSINNLKLQNTPAVVYENNPALSQCDVLLLCSSDGYLLNTEKARLLSQKCLVIDVGIGCIEPQAVEILHRRGIEVFRLDISNAVVQEIINLKIAKSELERIGKRIYGDYLLVSGGYIGPKNSVIVDDVRNPQEIFGFCTGDGRVIQADKEEKERLLSEIKNH